MFDAESEKDAFGTQRVTSSIATPLSELVWSSVSQAIEKVALLAIDRPVSVIVLAVTVAVPLVPVATPAWLRPVSVADDKAPPPLTVKPEVLA